MDETVEDDQPSNVSNVSNYYDGDDCGWEPWQLLVTVCVVAGIAALTFLIWAGIAFSRRVDVEHEHTNQTRIQACQHSDNVQTCIVKTEP
jgi:hypothetical protein